MIWSILCIGGALFIEMGRVLYRQEQRIDGLNLRCAALNDRIVMRGGTIDSLTETLGTHAELLNEHTDRLNELLGP